MRAILGIRIKWIGQPPASPYFLVCNHLSWQEIFVVNCSCDVVCVLQAEDKKLPFVGTLITGIRPIFFRRAREHTPHGIARMVETIQERKNLVLAPEGVVGPGREVRRFHAGLLQAAVQTRCPVHYLSFTYRTPEGWPPPSRVALFGPDPFFRTPDGRIPESELEAWGPERSFFLHLLGILALPWHEIIVRFAPEPISADDRIVLANRLHDAVQRIFTPLE
jgi:1-acyl-sn-glycerol-3-phosphate acyltransferase